MNPDIADTYATMIEELQPLAAALREAFPKPVELPPPPPIPVVYETADALDKAIANSTAGDVLLLSPSLVYSQHLIVQKITLKNSAIIDGLIPVDLPCPRFLDGLTLGYQGTIIGLEVTRTDPLREIVSAVGKDWTVRSCRILGDPVKGARRGIIAHGSNGVIQNSRIGHCFQAYPGNDSQAIIAWDTPGPLLIQGNYLRGGSETVMIGGSDPSNDTGIPSDIAILDNDIGADPAWQAMPIGVKSRLELKNCKHVLVKGNKIEQCWGKHGQDGYLCTINVRNQDGKAPFSTIEDVTVIDNDFGYGAAAINILGTDNRVGFPSQRMARVSITGNRFTNLDPVFYAGGTAKMIMLMGGADDLTIDGNTFAGLGFYSAVHFENGTYDRLRITGNQFPKAKYTYFGAVAGASLPKILAKFVTSGDLSNNVVQ